PVDRKAQLIDHLLRHVHARADLLDSAGAQHVSNGKHNVHRIRKLLHRFCAAAKRCALIGVDAFEPHQKIARAQLSRYEEAHSVRKGALSLEKHAAVIAPNILLLVDALSVLTLLREAEGSRGQENKKGDKDRLVNCALHTDWHSSRRTEEPNRSGPNY